jgi:carboxypeptidase C (cathepsin A)
MKHRCIRIFVLFTFLFCVFNFTLKAGGPKEAAAKKIEKKTTLKKVVKEELAVTNHTIKINGKDLKYRAAAGYMTMKDETGKHKASIFYVAYTKTGSSVSKRPLTFAFNGGPGSSAVWLHMGALGPKRVPMSDDILPVYAEEKYIDNEFSWLEFTDLVFIDPVSTGYSRPAQGVAKKEFHGVSEDIGSVGDFIRLYVTKNERWLSPKFIAGESYGTTRAGGLSGYLQDNYGMYLKGLVLISSALSFQAQDIVDGNDLPYVTFLPTFTASAYYHKRLSPELQKNLQATLKEVETWAQTEYTLALMKGDLLTGAERDKIIKKLSAYTGLPEALIDYYNLRIHIFNFMQELLRSKKLIIGRLDSRFTGYLRGFDVLHADPSHNKIQGAYTAAFNHYVRSELKYESDLLYEIISLKVYPWNWGQAIQGFVNTAKTLSDAMVKNNNLKVLVASGYYDMATPYFSSIYTFSHLGLPVELRKNIEFTFYEAGHMMYIHKPSLIKLRDDVAKFYRGALK